MDPATLVSDVSDHGFWQRLHAAQDSQEEESSVTKESRRSGSRSARGYGMADYEATHPMVVGSRKENGDSKPESTSGICCKLADQNIQASEAPKQDYIHVRAKRGQATDSHSLAERARREKISERMKILQDLVPGCNKVIGKASVLDEIINYIQSLQCQVEFLSMKLEAVDSRMNSTNEGFPTKDFAIQTLDNTAGSVFSPPRDYV